MNKSLKYAQVSYDLDKDALPKEQIVKQFFEAIYFQLEQLQIDYTQSQPITKIQRLISEGLSPYLDRTIQEPVVENLSNVYQQTLVGLEEIVLQPSLASTIIRNLLTIWRGLLDGWIIALNKISLV